jgi:tetratricopeptide (TPR) repeat protein
MRDSLLFRFRFLTPETATCLALIWIGAFVPKLVAEDRGVVQVVEEQTVLPTYQVGDPDPHPMFYDHESYQGAQKRIYPYALQDNLTHQRQDKSYTSLRLENDYVRITVLPELGGRLFSATDKTNNYEFFYRQHVIKPALIGMLGAWISGGVEWCAFHHHRNTTFMPVDYTLEQHADGSKTIWIGETERRQRMRWLIGLTLYPDRSYVEATVKFFNRTPQPYSILYWANVAVHVNDDYQVIFPPSVQVATYHSKIDFTHWPVAQGRYRGHNYQGVDVSWWKNSPVSNSFFAWNLQENFMGGYDHGRRAGVVHVGNHHVVCGAKLWEWGTGPYGRAWDQILTDEDGPYAELMVGAFSDNQPDYSWIKPYEVKTFRQYWYPIRDIGPFQNANVHGAVGMTRQPDGGVKLGFHTTASHSRARVILQASDQVLLAQSIDIGPDRPFTHEVELPDGVELTDLRVALQTAEGQELIGYQPVLHPPVQTLPDPVEAPAKPEELATNEELYLTGLRVEQIHNPSVDPVPYYQEAVRRDPGDSRANTALGIHFNKHGQYELAESHLRKAIARLSQGYTRLRDAEAYYQLGLGLRAQHRNAEAYDAFYRATWDADFHAASYYQLAELSCTNADFVEAMEHVEKSLATNAWNTKALDTKASILRKLGRLQQAAEVAEAVLAIDPLDFWAWNEKSLVQTLSGNQQIGAETSSHLMELMRGEAQSYLELATDYMNLGMLQEAIDLLQSVPVDRNRGQGDPLVAYYLGYLFHRQGDSAAASDAFRQAENLPIDYCFPFRLEGIDVFHTALSVNPADARAYYYLGNLLFDHQPEQAVKSWQKSSELDPSLAMVHRNLGWAYSHVGDDLERAVACYEQALKCQQIEPRLLLELDQLYEAANAEPDRRLAAMASHQKVVVSRQESFIREITVLVLTGDYEQAIRHLQDNFFHAQEGRDEIHDVYVDAHLLQGLSCMRQTDPTKALEHFEKAGQYPENLSVGRPATDPRAPQVAYYRGMAYDALGDLEAARRQFQTAIDQRGTERWPEARFYQAQSLVQLDRADEARVIFQSLIETGQQRLDQQESVDFFAKFGGQETGRTRMATGHYLVGLGSLGQQDLDGARDHFREAVRLNRSHVWARYEQSALDSSSATPHEVAH